MVFYRCFYIIFVFFLLIGIFEIFSYLVNFIYQVGFI